jgi:hypothetical protein
MRVLYQLKNENSSQYLSLSKSDCWLYIGILLSLAVAALLVLAIRDCNSNPDGLKTDHSLAFPIKFLIISAVFALIVTVLSGVGGYIFL